MNAGISSNTLQYVKKKLGIKSVHKADDWYWTLSGDAAAPDNDDPSDSESVSDADETPVVFSDEVDALPEPPKTPAVSFLSETVTVDSIFGKLKLIDWKACV